ncbi:MAG: tetratricopeptide repeat protein [Planctomycetes bacterium]|nr:tetratricopeptide repeat protein [Planctomycetota bacterium]
MTSRPPSTAIPEHFGSRVHAGFLGLVALAAGCQSSRPSLLPEAVRSGQHQGHCIEGVPFIRQQAYYCGPAAIAAVSGYFGQPLDQDQVAQEVFSSSLQATLTLDLELLAQKRGFWTRTAGGNMAGLTQWIDRDIPPVVLVRVGPPGFKRFHFIVLTGYDATRKMFLAHDGIRPDREIPSGSLEKRWAGAARWSLVLLPPERATWPLAAAEHNDLAVFYEKRDRLTEARQHYDRAIEMEPGRALYFFNRANLLYRLLSGTEAEEALWNYRKALELNPDYPDAHNNLACVLMGLGRLDEALLHAQKAVKSPSSNRYHYWETLADVHTARKEYAEALTAYEEALERTRPAAPAWEKLALSAAEIEARLGHPNAARSRLKALLNSHPTEDASRRARILLQAQGLDPASP